MNPAHLPKIRTDATLATFGLLGRAPSTAEVTLWTERPVGGPHHCRARSWLWYSAEHANRVRTSSADQPQRVSVALG